MRQRLVKPQKLAGVPEWFFRWRPRGSPLVPKLIALVLVGAGFVFLVTSVRIRVAAPEKVSPHKASVIYLGNDLQGRALSSKAQEGGPFPSRFDLSQWGGLADLETAAMETVRFQAPTYQPEIEDPPPVNEIKSLPLAAKGERFFPTPIRVPASSRELAALRLTPVLYPLSGISKDALPADLPEFEPVVDAEMASGTSRFLLRLNSAGGVMECVSLEKGGEKGAQELEKWLHRIPFKPDSANASRWIAVGIGFTNQPADGTDAE
jgi:hypothetical protein